VKALATIGLLLLAEPAAADTTAVYSGASSTITVEVATNGDARVTAGPNGAYLLRKADDVFFIAPDPSGHCHVFKAADFIAVQEERAENLLKQFPGLRGRIVSGERQAASHNALVAGGEVTVRGRSGTAYLPWPGAQNPIVVISHDTSLTPLRYPMLMAEEFADGLARAQVSYDPTVDRMVEVLKTGPPLKLLGSELAEVRGAPISPSRFQLPSQPETRDQIRREFEAQSQQPNR
jgi:hypothetical protein